MITNLENNSELKHIFGMLGFEELYSKRKNEKPIVEVNKEFQGNVFFDKELNTFNFEIPFMNVKKQDISIKLRNKNKVTIEVTKNLEDKKEAKLMDFNLNKFALNHEIKFKDEIEETKAEVFDGVLFLKVVTKKEIDNSVDIKIQ